MALVLRNLYSSYWYYTEELKDPRIDHYFLLGSPIKVITLVGLYLYFVKSWGPRFMQNRKPFELNRIIAIYNVIQIILNGIIAYVSTKVLLTRLSEISCVSIDYSHTESGIFEAQLTYSYYMMKILDLMDTIFMVLRKKDKQLSFLHIYHHTLLVIVSYAITRYSPGGHGGMVGILNCYVHVVMYFYYFLTSFKPELKKSIWWKRHITHIQMLQFTTLCLYLIYPLIFGGCSYPKPLLYFGVLQNLIFCGLFSDFYFKEYINKKNKKL